MTWAALLTLTLLAETCAGEMGCMGVPGVVLIHDSIENRVYSRFWPGDWEDVIEQGYRARRRAPAWVYEAILANDHQPEPLGTGIYFVVSKPDRRKLQLPEPDVQYVRGRYECNGYRLWEPVG